MMPGALPNKAATLTDEKGTRIHIAADTVLAVGSAFAQFGGDARHPNAKCYVKLGDETVHFVQESRKEVERLIQWDDDELDQEISDALAVGRTRLAGWLKELKERRNRPLAP